MSDYIKRIKTSSGDKQIDYNALANLPEKTTVIDENTSDASLPTTKAVKDYVDAESGMNTITSGAEGVAINVTDSANAKLKGLKIFGKTTQADTPTIENPQELVSVGSGGTIQVDLYSKNLIPYPYLKTNHTSNGVTFVVNDDGSITVNGTATADAYFNFANANLLKGTYCISGCPSGGSTTTYYLVIRGYDFDIGKGSTFTVKTSWSNNYQIMIKSGYTANNLVFRPQLNIGLSATPYEKGSAVQSATFNTPNGLHGIPVSSGGNYTDENGQQWFCDEIDLARGKYVQRVNKYICTGDETWASTSAESLDTNDDSTIEIFYIKISGAMLLKTSDSRFKCSHSEVSTQTWNRIASIGKIVNTSTVIFQPSFVLYEGVYTIDTWKAKVKELYDAGTPIEILYILATPSETDLTEEEIAQYKALTTHKPVTNIFNDANAHMEVEYVADTKTYIDNKIEKAVAELSAAILTE